MIVSDIFRFRANHRTDSIMDFCVTVKKINIICKIYTRRYSIGWTDYNEGYRSIDKCSEQSKPITKQSHKEARTIGFANVGCTNWKDWW